MTRAVRTLLIVNVAIFLVQMIVDPSGRGFTKWFDLGVDELLRFQVWRLVTYMFLHGGIWHILGNMLMLYFFGIEMESVLGTRRFLKLYFGCGILAGIGWMAVTALMRQHAYCIGASGAIFGVMGTFAAMFPNQRITLLLLFVLPVTMTARTMIIWLGVGSVVLLVIGYGHVAHAAHLAGGIAGYMYGLRMARYAYLLGVEERRGGGGGVFSGWMARMRGRFRRPRMRVHRAEDGRPAAEEVDRVLEKISERGIDSLSAQERRTLERAAEWRNRQGEKRGERGARESRE